MLSAIAAQLRKPLRELHLQERWETSGAEYVQTTDGKAATTGVSVQVNATGDVHAASEAAELLQDTEKENEHRVRHLHAVTHCRLP